MATIPKWKHISEIHREAIDYIEQRRDGSIKSIKTKWEKFNDAGVDGLEWGTITTVAGRAGSGKTLIVKEITSNAHKLNPTQDFAVLDLQFEMSTKSTGVREFSSVINKTYKELLSVGKKIDEDDLNKLKNYSRLSASQEIYQVDTPMTVGQIKQTILEFLSFVKKPVIVTLDHSVLIKRAAGEKDIFESLYALGEMLTELKKLYPVMFIILTQMNRSIEDQNRKIPGTAANYPTTADVFGGDSLYMHSDILIVINRPALYNMDVYGPEQFEVDDKTLAMHFLKARNGDNRLCFFKAQFEHMKIVEIAAPPQRHMRTRVKIS